MNHSLYIIHYITKQLYNRCYIIIYMSTQTQKIMIVCDVREQKPTFEELENMREYKRKMLELYSKDGRVNQ